jgi:hypothetical protein
MLDTILRLQPRQQNQPPPVVAQAASTEDEGDDEKKKKEQVKPVEELSPFAVFCGEILEKIPEVRNKFLFFILFLYI